jgi:hypothetical protein
MSNLPPLPLAPLGRYRHYKGGEYEVIGVARHSESLEPMVLYRPLYNESGLWVRPYAMFFEEVEFEGKRLPRFAAVKRVRRTAIIDGSMKTNHPVRCKCGAFKALVSHPERGTRVVCYCRDCQAFAHFLGLPENMLDSAGGTDIVAVRPMQVEILEGIDNLTCMSLSPKGTLRWYTSCCRTPVGNTPRDFRKAHVGLVHSCLESSGTSMDDSFGPVRMRVNLQSAKGKPGNSPPIGFALALLRYLGSMAWSRVSGAYRDNPFFIGPAGTPRVEPRVLSLTERNALFNEV